MDTPEDIQARRSLFAKFARLKAHEEEKDRAKNPLVTQAAWVDPTEDEQLGYVAPYKAEYEGESEGIVTRLNRLRGRKIGNRPLNIANDFEQTSTILPPPTVQEYSSNISTDELRKTYFPPTYKPNSSLTIYSQRNHIINSINSYGVIIIEGATGCGKTTQVPVYILEDAILEKPGEFSPVIYVTQPRRIAARSIANRVCEEHNWDLGSIVGYQVGLDKVVGPQTVLVFCTAGVLLQKLIQEKSLEKYSHIIIDEAHERDADTDLLLMMIRTLMRKEMSFFRLIIMSATMDGDKLKRYFTFKNNYGHQSMTVPSTIHIGQEKAPSNIQVIHYDKIKQTFGVDVQLPEFEMDNPELHELTLKSAVKIIVDVIPHLDTFSEMTQSTLVFLPGLAEICKLDRMIRSIPGASDNLDIIPLHSCLTVQDQIRVFHPSRPGCRKVILATNIAESSITVKDAGFIVDFCLTKTLRKDNLTRFPTLKLQWSTKDKSTQRAGRTGRCCAGKVFRMVPFNFYKDFKNFAEPELLTAPLELSVLRVKNFQMGEIQALFAVVLDPPPLDEIRTAVLELKQIGALSSTFNGELSNIDGDLTELGQVISVLPIDVHLSKLIVIASIFDVLEDAIVVAACLSTNRSVVKHLYGESLENYERKLDWAKGSYSDLFVSLDVYNEFREYKEYKGKDDRWLAGWCAKRALDERKLHDVSALIAELKNRLEGVNIRIFDQPNRIRDENEDNLMLKVAFCAAFYPNYFLAEKLDIGQVEKDLCGLDPTKTVIMHNLPVNQVPLYRTPIVKYLKNNICKDLEFISDCSKALVILKDDIMMSQDERVMNAIGVDGVIQSSKGIERCVYRAVKLAESEKLIIREYNNDAAQTRMDYYNKERDIVCQTVGRRLLPNWLKLVEGQADNNRFLDANDDEFAEMTQKNFYIEVKFNQEQDRIDQKELINLEDFENKERSLGKTIDMSDHPTFKTTYRQLRGPESPIRMMFRSVLNKSRGFSVEIDPISVNSILLDADYKQDRRQMLVGASVCQTKRSRVMVRDSTLMPNIRGLPTLMALLFAQYYRVYYNEHIKCISGAIFGLGWDDNDKPIDSSYEVEIGFDVHITPDDIELINSARKRMSKLLNFVSVNNPGSPQSEMQRELRDIILALMRKRRYPLEEIEFSVANCQEGGGFVVDKHNVPREQLEQLGDNGTRSFLPLMEISRKYTQMDVYESIRANLNHLDAIMRGEMNPPVGGIRCVLCGNGVGHFFMFHNKIARHLDSDEHQQKLKTFVAFEERAARQQQAECNGR